MAASTQTGERGGAATATLAAGELDATFATGAGMKCCSPRHRGDELLGQRRGLTAYTATGSPLGTPFLRPWANRLAALRYEQSARGGVAPRRAGCASTSTGSRSTACWHARRTGRSRA